MKLYNYLIIYLCTHIYSACDLIIPVPMHGLYKTALGNGPKVQYSQAHTFDSTFPLTIPFPNDDLTRYDPQSPTFRRVHLNLDPQMIDINNRFTQLNQLDGFSTYAPITVSFDQAIDVKDLWSRHNVHDPARGRYRDDFRDDAVYLFNVDPQCKRYGEEVALDIGRGRFPITRYKNVLHAKDKLNQQEVETVDFHTFLWDILTSFPTRYNILFSELEEDLNQNKKLDIGEDRDKDGDLDHANFIESHACQHFPDGSIAQRRCTADQLMTFYEKETHTLLLRPIWPLEQRCRYAVVLTHRLKGDNGLSVRSPFKGVNPLGHTQALKPLLPWLNRYNLHVSDITFAWTFTTGTTTKDMEAVRAGLYGDGVFHQLSTDFPVEDVNIWQRPKSDHAPLEPDLSKNRTFSGGCIAMAMTRWWDLNDSNTDSICAIESDLSTIDIGFGGTFDTPNLLLKKNHKSHSSFDISHDPLDKQWYVDSHNRLIEYDKKAVPFWCTLPKQRDENCSVGNPEGHPFCKPFPTIIYVHGYASSRIEMIQYAGRANAMGYALCSLDLYGDHALHKLLDVLDVKSDNLSSILAFYGIPTFKDLITHNRDQDINHKHLDHDPLHHTGATIWNPNPFYSRDYLRQNTLDLMQFIRILRSFDGVRSETHTDILLGDIDQDGSVDLGGPLVPISLWGQSLGGLIAGIIAGLDPSLDAVVPHSGGAGLIDMMIRSHHPIIGHTMIDFAIGPMILGYLSMNEHQSPIQIGKTDLKDHEMELAFVVNESSTQKLIPFARLSNVEIGDWIELENLTLSKVRRGQIRNRGILKLSIASQAIQPSHTNVSLADQWIIRHFKENDQDTKPYAVIDSFQWPIEFQTKTYAANSPLVALQNGLGLETNTAAFRQFLQLVDLAIFPADPAIWSEHISLNRLDYSYIDQSKITHTRVLQVPTLGDQVHPINTGIAAARIQGLTGSWLRSESSYPDPRYGWRELFQPKARLDSEIIGDQEALSIDQLLIHRFVLEGDGTLQRYSHTSYDDSFIWGDETAYNEVLPSVSLFDIDNQSDGNSRFSCDDPFFEHELVCTANLNNDYVFVQPYDPLGLRVQRAYHDHRFDALRIPMTRSPYQHGVLLAQPSSDFDEDTYMVNFILRYLGSGGRQINHEAGCDCSTQSIADFTLNGESHVPKLNTASCTQNEVKLCNDSCAQAWGFRTMNRSHCTFVP